MTKLTTVQESILKHIGIKLNNDTYANGEIPFNNYNYRSIESLRKKGYVEYINAKLFRLSVKGALWCESNIDGFADGSNESDVDLSQPALDTNNLANLFGLLAIQASDVNDEFEIDFYSSYTMVSSPYWEIYREINDKTAIVSKVDYYGGDPLSSEYAMFLESAQLVPTIAKIVNQFIFEV